MKKLLSICLCILLFSCSKKNNNPSPPQFTTGSIQFKVNGNLVTMDNANSASGEGALFAKQPGGTTLPATRYLLNAQKDINNILGFAIVTDSLLEINYHYDSTFKQNNPTVFASALDYNGQVALLYFSGDYLDINISSYTNSTISGTFTAKLSPFNGILDYNQRGTLIITEGVLTNVPVTY